MVIGTGFAYIDSKVRHTKRFGIPADYSKATSAAQPAWRKEILKEEVSRHNHQIAVRLRREAREAAQEARRAKRQRELSGLTRLNAAC